jgi:hypothetical protein
MNRQTWRGLTLALMLGASAGALASTACAQPPPPRRPLVPGSIPSWTPTPAPTRRSRP